MLWHAIACPSTYDMSTQNAHVDEAPAAQTLASVPHHPAEQHQRLQEEEQAHEQQHQQPGLPLKKRFGKRSASEAVDEQSDQGLVPGNSSQGGQGSPGLVLDSDDDELPTRGPKQGRPQASILLGIAEPRKPRLGPQYQALIPDLLPMPKGPSAPAAKQ